LLITTFAYAQPKEGARLKPKVEGLVSQQYELAPPPDDRNYRNLQGRRVEEIGREREGRAQVTEQLPSVKMMTEMRDKRENERAERKRRQEVVETTGGNRRVRGDKSAVQNELFKLFADNSGHCVNTDHPEDKDGKPMTCEHCRTHWTTKDLVDKTGQPQDFLKEILKEMCEFDKRGEHQGTWRVKQW